MNSEPPTTPSPRDRRIIDIAIRETDPKYVDQFEPITKGPIVAVLWLGGIGVFAGLYVAWILVKKVIGR